MTELNWTWTGSSLKIPEKIDYLKLQFTRYFSRKHSKNGKYFKLCIKKSGGSTIHFMANSSLFSLKIAHLIFISEKFRIL